MTFRRIRLLLWVGTAGVLVVATLAILREGGPTKGKNPQALGEGGGGVDDKGGDLSNPHGGAPSNPPAKEGRDSKPRLTLLDLGRRMNEIEARETTIRQELHDEISAQGAARVYEAALESVRVQESSQTAALKQLVLIRALPGLAKLSGDEGDRAYSVLRWILEDTTRNEADRFEAMAALLGIRECRDRRDPENLMHANNTMLFGRQLPCSGCSIGRPSGACADPLRIEDFAARAGTDPGIERTLLEILEGQVAAHGGGAGFEASEFSSLSFRAAVVLGRSGTERALEALIKNLESDRPSAGAVWGLGLMAVRNSTALDTLIAGARESENVELRCECLDVLVERLTPTVVGVAMRSSAELAGRIAPTEPQKALEVVWRVLEYGPKAWSDRDEGEELGTARVAGALGQEIVDAVEISLSALSGLPSSIGQDKVNDAMSGIWRLKSPTLRSRIQAHLKGMGTERSRPMLEFLQTKWSEGKK